MPTLDQYIKMHELRIIIPAFNEEARIENSLKAVFDFYTHMRKDIKLEQVIIVNDGSTDHTGEVIKELIGNDNFVKSYDRITYIDIPENIGKANAVLMAVKSIPKNASPDSLVKLLDSDLVNITWKHIANEVYKMIDNPDIIMSLSFVPGSRNPMLVYLRYKIAKLVAKRGGAITGQRTLYLKDLKEALQMLPKENNCYQLEPTVSVYIHQKMKNSNKRLAFQLMKGVEHTPKFEKHGDLAKTVWGYTLQAVQTVYSYVSAPIRFFLRFRR